MEGKGLRYLRYPFCEKTCSARKCMVKKKKMCDFSSSLPPSFPLACLVGSFFVSVLVAGITIAFGRGSGTGTPQSLEKLSSAINTLSTTNATLVDELVNGGYADDDDEEEEDSDDDSDASSYHDSECTSESSGDASSIVSSDFEGDEDGSEEGLRAERKASSAYKELKAMYWKLRLNTKEEEDDPVKVAYAKLGIAPASTLQTIGAAWAQSARRLMNLQADVLGVKSFVRSSHFRALSRYLARLHNVYLDLLVHDVHARKERDTRDTSPPNTESTTASQSM